MNPILLTYESYDKLKHIKFTTLNIQRKLSSEVVDNIVKYISYRIANSATPFIPPISICKWNNMAYVVDGQHRLEALKKTHQPNIKLEISILEYIVKSYDEIIHIFQNMNKNTPLCQYELIHRPIDEKHLDDQIETFFENMGVSKYVFSERIPRKPRPCFFIKTFMEIYKTENILYKEIKNIHQFKIFFEKINKFYEQFFLNELNRSKYEVKPNMYNQATGVCFFLGLFKHEKYKHIFTKLPVEILKLYTD